MSGHQPVHPYLNRRRFLTRCAEISATGAGLYATLGSLSLIHAQQPAAGDYKALVCVFLYGGNDSYNMVVPSSTTEYGAYANARQTLAVDSGSLLGLNPLNPPSDGAAYGLHPSMGALQSLFNSGQLAVLGNVGSLVVPVVSQGQSNFGNVPVPPQLFSHNEQQSYWQSFAVGSDGRAGWAGRMSDLLASASSNQDLSLNINLGNANVWQVGLNSLPYSINPNGVRGLEGFNANGGPRQRQRLQTLQTLLDAKSGPLFAREYAAVKQRALGLGELVGSAFAETAELSTGIPDTKLGDQLNAVARMIAARETLGQSRQIFFVSLGGWDTHSDQLARHPGLLAELSDSLAAFYRATQDLNVADKVTTFTMSEFGRTLTSNGDGSDHGWGGHQLIIGDSVVGQNIYGEMPMLDIEGLYDAGRGRIIPTTSVGQYGATLARWFGLGDSEIDTVFPSLRANFGDDATDLGFMRS